MLNLNHLLDAPIDAPNATSVRPIPEKEDVLAIVNDIELVALEIKKGQRAGQQMAKLNIKWELLDESLKASMERETLYITQGILLDLDKFGNIDTGPDRNVSLGRVREALDLNTPGFTLGQLKGAGPAMLYIKQRPKSDEEPDVIYNDVARVTKPK